MAAVGVQEGSVLRSVTIEEPAGGLASSLRRDVPLTRTLSIREIVVPEARYPVEFRTLSLQVDQDASRASKSADAQKGTFKGPSRLFHTRSSH
jgi:hypothetical protein